MIITQKPLRISFLGGNTDFPDYYLKNGGAVLTAAIDKYIYCIVKERFDDDIRITYSIKEIVKNVKDIKHDLVREAMKLVGVGKGIEIMFLSDIPSEGAGLGSSSSVTVGILNALHQYKGKPVTARQLAQEACHIEIDILKKPIGVQDQYIAAFGGLNLIEFGKTIKMSPIRLPSTIREDFKHSVMLLYTGQTRNADTILSKMTLNKELLDQNKQLAHDGKVALCKGNISLFSQYMDRYWNLKRTLNAAVTNNEIDKLYEKAKKAGAFGGKIAGAGGGGFLVLMVPPEKKSAIRKKLGLRELPFGIATDGSKVIFNIRQ